MKKILSQPQNLFIIICLFFSGIFMFLNPPFQAPDEDAHLFKMYGYTIGSLNFKKDHGNAGQILPKNLVSLQKYYDRYKFKIELKTSMRELALASNIKLEKNETEFFKFVPTSYTPISYFPSFIILLFLKILSVKPLTMIYIMRFCSLLTYLALTYYAIKITPVKKWLFFVLATLPLNLYQASAISTDALTNGLVFLFIAYTLKLAYEDEKITNKKLGIWTGLITLINVCKFAYFPMVLLFFIIPKEKFTFSRAKTFFGIFAVNVLYIILFIAYTTHLGKDAVTELSAITVDKSILIKDIFKHPIDFLNGIWTTTVYLYRFYINNMISSFGWNSIMIPTFASNLYYVLMLLGVIYLQKDEPEMNLGYGKRAILILTIVLSYLLIATSVYLVYQRYPVIIGIQGRYLAPLLLILMLLFTNKFIKTENKTIPVVITMTSLFLLLTSVLVLIVRFY